MIPVGLGILFQLWWPSICRSRRALCGDWTAQALMLPSLQECKPKQLAK